MRPLRAWWARPRAPLAVAGFLAVPLFFVCLMAVSLAIEKPHVFQWTRGGKLVTTYHTPTGALEARIWLLSLVPPVVLVLVGALAMLVPRGVLLSSLAAIALCLAVTHRLDRWTAHHTDRFPLGVDLIPGSSTSNTLDPGQWEQTARHTALAISHLDIGLAIAAAAIAVLLELRRRFGGRPQPVPPPPAVVTGEPEVSPVVESQPELVRRSLARRWLGVRR